MPKRVVGLLVLCASPAWAQSEPLFKAVAAAAALMKFRCDWLLQVSFRKLKPPQEG